MMKAVHETGTTVSVSPIVYVTIFCLVNSAYSLLPSVLIKDSLLIGQKISFSGHEVNQYLGVPYAQPPVATLRFKKSVPLFSYPPILYAFTNPPACPQYSGNPYPWCINSTDKSEDCLYLNIWTPADASPSRKKAVMYWIHGGGYRLGSIRDKIYSGVPLVSLGDIIVVTVNYRVGPFGFLYSGSDDAPGNAGLYDILEGLKWVNKYIGVFGGDVARITIAGESVGSITVGTLAASPLAKGLYTRQIAESGSPLWRNVDNNTQNIALGQQLAKNVGCATDTFTIEDYPEEVVRCLRGVDAFTLSVADFFVSPNTPHDFLPRWGDDILPNNPRMSIINGNFNCTDLLIGNNKDEGSFLMATVNPEVYGFFGEKNPHISKALGKDTILTLASLYPNPQSIVDHYLPANLTDDSNHRIRQQTYTALGDLLLHCPTVYYAGKCAEQRQNVYYYVFTHRPSVSPWVKWMGTAHFEEVQFVFGQPILSPEKYLPNEVVLSRQIIDTWTSFVKDGKPNLPWPLYSREDPAFKYFGPGDVLRTNSESGQGSNCDFLRPFYGL